MVKHIVFGVERDIDIYADVFPTEEELEEMESRLPGCEHGWFDSVDNGLQLHYRKFLPAGPPKGIIIWMHGVQTHCGRAHILKDGRKINMALLSDRVVHQEGYALYAFDMTGHGYSEGSRFLVKSTVKQDYLNFVKLVVDDNNNENNDDNNIPLFLMGESFGGNLTLQIGRYYQDHPDETPKGFAGIILVAAAIYGYQIFFPVDLALKYFLTPFVPRLRPPEILPNPVAPSMLWRDPEVLYINAQEKRVTEMWLEPAERHSNLQTSSTLIEAMKYVRNECIPDFKGPFCILHGTSDRAVPIAGALEYFVEQVATPEPDRAVKRVGGAYHDLLGDPTAEENLDFILEWVKKRIEIMAKK
ncbi:Monoglyceride lipase [Seminavis robusta]|uniref:Monoglyceride lipase n=1 Tax=Seminavis robusta TaxID=568900 RepID=A0A9N8DDU2_9STRA|nr:Monoglyceride lipase [Seminavis robusta]|eukprot:Sro43_g026070.1 Monoglyceride lipase (358) ;mRNA; f:44417-45490